MHVTKRTVAHDRDIPRIVLASPSASPAGEGAVRVPLIAWQVVAQHARNPNTTFGERLQSCDPALAETVTRHVKALHEAGIVYGDMS